MFPSRCGLRLIWALGLMLSAGGLASGEEPTTRGILILNSWHKDMPWQVQVERGLKQGMKDLGPGFQVFAEYLDAGRFPEKPRGEVMPAYLEGKYGGLAIDVIIGESRPAANFLRDHPGLLPRAKRVFVQPGARRGDRIGDAAAAIPIDVDYSAAVSEMLRVAAPRRIHVVADTFEESSGELLEGAKAALAAVGPDVEVEYILDQPLDDLRDRLSRLPPGSVIFYMPVFRDAGTGRRIVPYDAAKLISERASAPMFSAWESFMGSGILGGYLISGERVGKAAADAIKVFAEGRPPPVYPASAVHVHAYDWRQLRRWGIAEDRLPREADIRFHEPSLWEKHRLEIVGVLSFTVLLAGLSAVLLVVNRKRLVAVRALTEERHSLERRVAERTAELARSEERYRQMFAGNKAVGLLIDPADGRIVDANRAAEVFYGWTRDELLARRIADINTPASGEGNVEMEGARAEDRNHYFFRHRLASGLARDVEVHSGPIEIEGRTLLYSIIHDVTERREAEEALLRKNEELARSNAELESFAYVASHDLREPLRNVTNFSTLLSRSLGDKLDADQREYLKFIHGGALRMDHLVRDLLNLSRVGRLCEPMSSFPMRAALDAVLGHMRAHLDECAAEVEIAPDLPAVLASRDELERVLLNLIGNALKYRDAGRPPHLVFGCVREGDPWHFSLKDNGIGIPSGEGYEVRIFRLFQRLHQRDEYGGGTGVGLAVCKKIVERHGGRIWVESEGIGKGSTFHFTLPAAD